MSVRHALLVDFPETPCVVLTESVARFRRAGGDAEVVDLAGRLGFSATETTGRHLTVSCGSGQVTFETNAVVHLTEVDDSWFVRLPRLCRSVGCATWVRGVVLLPVGDAERLALWIDLKQLAGSVLNAETQSPTEGRKA